MTWTDELTRRETTSAGTPRLRCQVIEPVRTWCGLRDDGHLLTLLYESFRYSQVFRSWPWGQSV